MLELKLIHGSKRGPMNTLYNNNQYGHCQVWHAVCVRYLSDHIFWWAEYKGGNLSAWQQFHSYSKAKFRILMRSNDIAHLQWIFFYSFWPGDAIWHHKTLSTSIQVMACCLMALYRHLNQCRWITWRQISLEMFKISILDINLEMIDLRLKVTSPMGQCFNPLRAKFFGENINIYLHFMSFLHINKTQVIESPPWVKQGPACSTHSISWLLMSWRVNSVPPH